MENLDPTLDYRRFFVPGGEPGFSPERNKDVIDRTIKHNDMLRRRKQKEYEDRLGERADAIVSYLFSLKHSLSPIERYFGRRELARLRGQKIAHELQSDGSYKLIEL